MLSSRFARYVGSVGVLGVVGALVAAAGNAGAVSPAAAGGTVETQVFKTVNQEAQASGAVTSNSMVTQVLASGNGTMNVQVPVGASSSRNLNGFGGAQIQGNSIVLNQQVNGSAEHRYMTTTDQKPIQVQVETTLDGKSIKPEDVVNKSGVLDVKYHISNTTATKKPVTFTDATGNVVTQEMETAVPFTGSLEFTLPPGFNEVHAPGANAAAGDGHNGTLVNYSIVLFPPLGGTQFPSVGASHVTLGYQSRITNGTLPAADFNFTPVVPYSDSTIAQTKDALQTEASDGTELVSAGNEMGQSLGKLTGPQGVPYLITEMQQGAQKAQKSLSTLLGPVSGTDAMGSALDIRDSIKTKVLGALTKQSNQAAIDQLADIETLMDQMLDQYLPKLPDMLIALGDKTISLGGMTATVAQVADLLGTMMFYYASSLQTTTADITTKLATVSSSCGAPCQTDVDAITAANAQMTSAGNDWMDFATLIPGGMAGWAWPDVVSWAVALLKEAVPQLLALPVVQDLFNDGPKLKQAIGNFVDGTYTMLDQAQATLDAVDPTAEPLEGLISDLEGSVPISQAIGDDANNIVAVGADQLTSLGQQLVDENAPPVAQLNAMQAEAETGVGIPYGRATGEKVSTFATYNLTVAGAGQQGKDNAINWVLGIILLVVAGGVGTSLWTNRRRATA